jgi:hypothetical protein
MAPLPGFGSLFKVVFFFHFLPIYGFAYKAALSGPFDTAATTAFPDLGLLDSLFYPEFSNLNRPCNMRTMEERYLQVISPKLQAAGYCVLK